MTSSKDTQLREVRAKFISEARKAMETAENVILVTIDAGGGTGLLRHLGPDLHPMQEVGSIEFVKQLLLKEIVEKTRGGSVEHTHDER